MKAGGIILCQGSKAMQHVIDEIAVDSDFEWRYFSDNQNLASLTEAAEAVAIWVEMSTTVDDVLVNKFKNLKLVATTTTGVSHIDCDYLKSRNIRILDLSDFKDEMRNISSTAELAWLLILATWRRINLYLIEEFPKSLNASRWIYETSQIKGKTLGIIGFGRIGSMVAVYARSFGMNVVVFDPKYSHKLGGTQDFSVVSEIKDLLKVSDVCLLSASQQKSKSQTPILGCEELRHVKAGAILVNISRGRLWSESCVKEALISGRIAGVGVDVYSDEEISGGAKGMQSPLFTIDAKKFNIVRTPHIGGATMDAIMYTSRLMAHAISRELNSTK